MKDNSKYITCDDALKLNRNQVRENYKEYVNSNFVSMLSMLQFDKLFVKAKGVSVWDSDGNEYLDFLGGYGALNLGHNPDEIYEAIEKVKDLPNILQAAVNDFPGALAYDLALVTPGDLKRSFFCNSGAEAVEGALKLAKIASGKHKIVYCKNSFHGKSAGALSVTGREKYQKYFKPLVPDTVQVEYGDADALEDALKGKDVAAFIVEPIQGEGGVIVPHDGYLKEVRELTTKYDAYLIFDEVQTGFGRTGKMFACEHENVVPDIMCLAKSLGGGVMPIGAYIAKDDVWKKGYGTMDRCLLHTSTFGGNTLACAAGITAIKLILDKNLPEAAKEKGEYFLGRLKELKEKHKLIKDVRGKGLMIGVEFNQPEGGIIDKLSGGAVSRLSNEYLGSLVAGELQNKHHIITAYTLNNPNVIRFEPPLIVTKEQLDRVVEALDEIMTRSGSLLGMTLSSAKTVIGSLFNR
ncbi:aspartate aminotransferase family protein [Thermoanaerobacterium thermosaccharolyticum]|jgi:putrescine aminotransferase|uniref:Acetylornithine transaminase n=2 Tax=Thermoanaerobacterium thermosaccharolyticum TaxID=1517 RepID=D9TRD7_THETC|nr:aspartate aminotransferase family protein [Thermoanaerobacterium thermosaccharolyticum]ADL67957.1 Acetylornithine transaminase [Thermoanaerobacterium thermosaccharolyticum DSM 571]KAA5806993.1 aspartate aminotransferase family protein [Thermoanaerobacterium thermosaccharolyticum]OXT08300.1 aspartate aminotransferase family protein [Thermoanaerobacterium thermosaccharolyticum]